MKPFPFIFALCLATIIVKGQAKNDPVTVRVKKIEKVNGVERISDTIYTVKGPLNLTGLHEIESLPPLPGIAAPDNKRIIVITDKITGDKKTELKECDLSTKEEVEEILINLDLPNSKDFETQMYDLNKVITVTDENGVSQTKQILVIRQTRLLDITEEDKKTLGGLADLSEGKLAAENMNFYPNPSDGQFNLSFTLKEKGDAEIKIMNAEGKIIYTENVKNINGEYSKPFDISKQPKGVYFLSIKQGEHSQLKKIILE